MTWIGLLIAVVLLGGFGSAHGQDGVAPRPLFADDETLELTIEGPFRQLSGDGRQRPERDGLVRYRDAGGNEVVLDVAIRVRGNSRLEICSFPPLRLNFKRGQVPGTVFAGQNQLKLVTLCKSSDRYHDYLAQEFQIYRAFSALTDRAFRVRRANVRYVETQGRRANSFTEPAFLLEAEWEVAERHGMEALEVESLDLSELDPETTALVSLFHFMIGNTDWSGTSAPEGESCCHNGKVLGMPGSDSGRVLVPYDFDNAGLISTDYAEPNAALAIRSVRQRLYRGYCPMNTSLGLAIRRLNEQRAAVVGAFDSESVSESARRRALTYINESYGIINDPLRIETDILARCRG